MGQSKRYFLLFSAKGSCKEKTLSCPSTQIISAWLPCHSYAELLSLTRRSEEQCQSLGYTNGLATWAKVHSKSNSIVSCFSARCARTHYQGIVCFRHMACYPQCRFSSARIARTHYSESCIPTVGFCALLVCDIFLLLAALALMPRLL